MAFNTSIEVPKMEKKIAEQQAIIATCLSALEDIAKGQLQMSSVQAFAEFAVWRSKDALCKIESKGE